MVEDKTTAVFKEASMLWSSGLILRRETMLVLSRKRSEVILINDDITITVVDIRGDKVRIGIEAPDDVTVHRAEFYNAIKSDIDNAIKRYRARF